MDNIERIFFLLHVDMGQHAEAPANRVKALRVNAIQPGFTSGCFLNNLSDFCHIPLTGIQQAQRANGESRLIGNTVLFDTGKLDASSS